MDARLQRRVQRYGWDKAAAHYERFWARQLQPAQDRLMERAQLQPGERVLDVACGTGLVTFRAAAAVGPTGSVVGTDISEVMVESVATAAVTRGLPTVTARRMDGEVLQLPPAAFDAALCALGLMYMPDPGQSLRAMRAVLAPTGRTVAAVWGARSRCGWAEIFPIVERRVASDVCPLFFQLGTGQALAYEFEAAGYRDVTTDRIETVLDYESDEDACGAAFVGGPVALTYAHFDERVKAEARAEYLASIREFRTGDRYAIPGEFVVVRGRA